MHALFLLILIPGIYLLCKDYIESKAVSWIGILLVLIYLLIQFIYENFYRVSNINCPICKSPLVPVYERIANEKEEWVQIQFPCKKCNIAWDTGERLNVNDQYQP